MLSVLQHSVCYHGDRESFDQQVCFHILITSRELREAISANGKPGKKYASNDN